MASVFDDILGTLFGGADTSAQDFQRAANEEARRAVNVSTAQARADVLGLFPESDINRNLGFQGALDVLGQTIPQQLGVFQAGNVGAQEALLAGLPQFRSAILGGQFDPSGLQATELAFDPSFAQQTLPEFSTSAAPRTQQQQQAQATQALSQLLAGAGGGLSGDGGQPGFLEGAEARRARSGTFDASALEGDLSGFLSGVSGFLESPQGKLAAAAVPGGGLALLVNEIFGGAGSESAALIGTSAEPGISDAARANRLRAEREVVTQRARQPIRFGESGRGGRTFSVRDRGRTGGGGSATGVGLSSRGGGGTSFF